MHVRNVRTDVCARDEEVSPDLFSTSPTRFGRRMQNRPLEATYPLALDDCLYALQATIHLPHRNATQRNATQREGDESALKLLFLVLNLAQKESGPINFVMSQDQTR